MKKSILRTCIAFSMLIFSMTLGGCFNSKNEEVNNSNENVIHIVSTMFPQYDWVNEIIGTDSEKIKVTLLSDKGVDMHNYEPSAEDIMTIKNSDLFIYVGGESEEWVDDVLKNNKDVKALCLMESLGDHVKEEEIIEGMEEDEHEDEEHEHDHDHDEVEKDEHIWLSLNNAKILSQKIYEEIVLLNKENTEIYKENLDNYLEKLNDLDNQYKTALQNTAYDTLLFGDRFPFRYLTSDYGLKYYAAFSGCSAETEASFKTIKFLAEKVDELKLKYVLVVNGSNTSIAETIVNNTSNKNIKILALNSMESMKVEDINNNLSYISVMESNLEVLKEALE